MAGPAQSLAQDEVEDEPPPVYVAELRTAGRLVIGFDFGIGLIDATCDGCYSVGGLSMDGFAGLQLTPRLALVADAWSMLHLLATDTEDSGIASHGLGTAGARVWLAPKLWIQGGLGGGLFSAGPRGSGALLGPGAMLAVGGEPGHRRCSGIDLSARLGGTLLSDEGERLLLYSIAAVVGYHWN
jgi:hypothetical protein